MFGMHRVVSRLPRFLVLSHEIASPSRQFRDEFQFLGSGTLPAAELRTSTRRQNSFQKLGSKRCFVSLVQS